MKLIILVFITLGSSVFAQSKVLILGDSHMAGPFGRELDRLAREIPNTTVSTYGSCGSIAKWWFTGEKTTCGYWEHAEEAQPVRVTISKTPLVKDLLLKHKPNFVVIELSANYGSTDVAIAKSDMLALAKAVKTAGIPCLWVTTPTSRFSKINRTGDWAMDAIKGTCEVFDSRTVTHYPPTGGDGVHFSFPAGLPIAMEWAKVVSDRLAELLSTGSNL